MGKYRYDEMCIRDRIYTIEDTRKFSIDPTDICRIPHDIIDDDKMCIRDRDK